jgi:hypothetical protein
MRLGVPRSILQRHPLEDRRTSQADDILNDSHDSGSGVRHLIVRQEHQDVAVLHDFDEAAVEGERMRTACKVDDFLLTRSDELAEEQRNGANRAGIRPL